MTPLRSYLVCATPRSGSTLLCHLLDQTGIAGHPEEYFEALRHSGVPRRPHASFAAINYLVRLLTAHDASWDAYFLGLGAEPLKVTYEELAEAPDPVVRRVLAHLGIPVPADLALDAPVLAVQADARSEEWVRRVHEHLVAFESPAAATI
jgi:LPS sulfotransferase NodH